MSWTINISEDLIEEMARQLDIRVCDTCREYMLTTEGKTFDGEAYYCNHCFQKVKFPHDVLENLKELHARHFKADWDLAVTMHDTHGYEDVVLEVETLAHALERIMDLGPDNDLITAMHKLHKAYTYVIDLLVDIANLGITKKLPTEAELLGRSND